jgi:hypothetical protein
MRRFFKNMQEFFPSFFEEETEAFTEYAICLAIFRIGPFSELD